MKHKKEWIIIAALCVFLCTWLLAACGAKEESSADTDPGPVLTGAAVLHEHEFGGICIDISIDGFNALGFEFGDSVDIAFSNGYVMTDIPYYNGYYTLVGDPLLVGYPGSEHIKAAINSGNDLWDVAGLEEGATADITLNEKGKYLNVQEARDLVYEDDRAAYDSDEEFANFRCVSLGQMKEDTFYRSASPCDNIHNRRDYVDALMEEAGVHYVVDLADDADKLSQDVSEPDFDCPYYMNLYENGLVIPLALNMNFSSEEFKEKTLKGILAMSENEGPYLVHCTEGKDRTGFFCMLVEALAGASYQEIVDDYMITYDNYYGISESSDPEKYDILVQNLLDPMIESIVGDDSVDITTADLSSYAEDYLRACGMQEEQMEAFREKVFR